MTAKTAFLAMIHFGSLRQGEVSLLQQQFRPLPWIVHRSGVPWLPHIWFGDFHARYSVALVSTWFSRCTGQHYRLRSGSLEARSKMAKLFPVSTLASSRDKIVESALNIDNARYVCQATQFVRSPVGHDNLSRRVSASVLFQFPSIAHGQNKKGQEICQYTSS
jgi:hypothetical protein